MNIKFDSIPKIPQNAIFALLLFVFSIAVYQVQAKPALWIDEPIQACVIARDVDLTDELRARFAHCLGWQSNQSTPICQGAYQPVPIEPLNNPDELVIRADSASFYQNQRSTLSGHVALQQNQKILNAQTAYIYRDSKTNQVTHIELLEAVRFLEPDKILIAKSATFNPQDKSGLTKDVLYRLNTNSSGQSMPVWGRAALIQRFANQDLLLKKATYTSCAPQDKAWDIKADSITIDESKATGVARHAMLRIHEWPLLYSPYLSFPTNKARKSGFLMPVFGYSNVGGTDFGLPYYINLAPNYDLTLTPHVYSKRGVMMGGEYRFLTGSSFGVISGDFLPQDKAFKNFLNNNIPAFPMLDAASTNRWTYNVRETTYFSPNLLFNLNLTDVSDDYYLQDFSTNWALITDRQLLRQADMTYTTDHWMFRGMGQSYKTLEPINEIPIAPVYERLPELAAQGYYGELPFHSNLSIRAQYDQFHWPVGLWNEPLTHALQGPRVHFNPILSAPQVKPWGYITPSIQLVENYYSVQGTGSYANAPGFFISDSYWDRSYFNFNRGNPWDGHVDYNRFIPRYSVDSGLYFERLTHAQGLAIRHTLEPRLFYLNVPYQNQTPIPVYDSGWMIFNVDQLFRTNRFSGFDRIGDANQLAYALTSRWLSDNTGIEFASLSVGQIRYFANRRVQLCQSPTGFCVDDPLVFGNLSSTSKTSPIASRGLYRLNSIWGLSGDYVWDPATHATNNGDLNVHYQPNPNAIVNFSYSYLVNGDVTQVGVLGHADNALHQAIASISWPITEKWSTVGAYSHNISKNYSMMSLLGLQYNNCCWAMRLVGGRAFKNLNPSFEPQYSNNVYLQILLKGLGTVENSDPNYMLSTYIPGYNDLFRR